MKSCQIKPLYDVIFVGRFYDLSHPFGDKLPLWPYFSEPIIERMHYHSKSGVLTQRITTVMHTSTHADSPVLLKQGKAKVVKRTPFTSSYYMVPAVTSSP